MRVLALFLAAFLTSASIVLAAEAPIATAGACAPACPSTDKDGFALNHQSDDEDANTITCTYGEPDDDSYCTYNAMSGMLTEDHDGNSCQTLATTACSRRVKRFNPAQNKVRNLVRKHTAHIARKTKTIKAASHSMGGVNGAAKAQTSPRAVPYFVTSRARLSRRFRNHF
ncbi:hypothetical protein EXIGLDRAFT_718459 [Exidia glandulosa HHB12029]|uniref:Uncharacterized protein n=1 Tax=Exidia glandulosa HHB12029 TaxID=1314781 RepID=A0A165NWF9_EXIGL|nr:hypothetical protein EXIGLDRAFT_718459 [Exidia glandulosa HHB12029]